MPNIQFDLFIGNGAYASTQAELRGDGDSAADVWLVAGNLPPSTSLPGATGQYLLIIICQDERLADLDNSSRAPQPTQR
jgi:hypothetical protein